MDPRAAHRRHLGRCGEDLVAAWYEGHGYHVVARNWSCRAGELDIVARRANEYVFCEVKTRSSVAFGWPAEAVGPVKQGRLRRLAAIWLAAERGHRAAGVGERPCDVRFDVASVLGTAIEVVEGAF